METEKPQCIGFIMDGNRRWAKNRGLETLEGHAAGAETLKKIIGSVYTAAIPHMVCYAFSTENWNRTPAEVSYLMILLQQSLTDIAAEIQNGTRRIAIRVIGERTRLPQTLQDEIVRIESLEKEDTQLTVWIALSYGGRAEIINAARRIKESNEEITEETFSKMLWTNGMPDPDIVIRTSGEKRISNFLLWQSAYSEFFFTETLWPDFGETELQSMLEQYATRQRRKGS
jgi:undecaprenyl diphosphate synthase